METTNQVSITIETTVNATVKKVWEAWTNPKHIINWCFASPNGTSQVITQELLTLLR